MDSMLFPKGDTAKRVLNDNSFDDHGKVFYIEKIPRENPSRRQFGHGK